MAVALSGGRDSAALLAATVRSARAWGVEVVALHVHHGLSPHADAWLAHCRRLCRTLGSTGPQPRLFARRLRTRPARGESLEAWARRERYRALAAMARRAGASLVLLAHHRRDQAETVLLQALRGGGPAGLSAMPRAALRDGLTWARPWLDVPREAVEAYAQAHGIAYVDDDSNADPRHARNALRLHVWPALLSVFPDAEPALARAAAQAQQARHALDEWLAQDLAAVAPDDRLDVAAWRALGSGRRAMVLGRWLHDRTGHPVPHTLVARLMIELNAERPARWPWAGGELRAYRGALRWVPAAAPTPRAEPARADEGAAVLHIRRAGRYRVPGWGGCLRVRRVERDGIALSRLDGARAIVRSGGETFQFAPLSQPRSLKKQFQAARRPAWERGVPLIVDAAGALLFVPGLGLDARALDDVGTALVRLDWEPDAPRG